MLLERVFAFQGSFSSQHLREAQTEYWVLLYNVREAGALP